MERAAYLEQALAHLHRVTNREKEAIRQELEGHIEDHMEGLLALGWDEQLAEERTLAAMGDPVEMAQELDRQYPVFWLLLGRAALVLTAVMCILALTFWVSLSTTWDSVIARVDPPAGDMVEELQKDAVPVDIRIPVGNDILRIYAIGIYDLRSTSVAALSICAYDRLPGGTVSQRLLYDVKLENQRGDMKNNDPSNVFPYSLGAGYTRFCVPVAPGDTYVTLVYDVYDYQVYEKIPLPKEVTP